MPAIAARMAENGLITIPLDVRAALGLGRGGLVVLEAVEGELPMRNVARAMGLARAASQRIVGRNTSVCVDGLLADRRCEATPDK